MKLQSGVEGKGVKKSDSHHHFYFYYTLTGKKSSIFTKVSHSGKTLGSKLISKIKRQCKLKTPEDLLNLVECPLSQEEYEQHLIDNGFLRISLNRVVA